MVAAALAFGLFVQRAQGHFDFMHITLPVAVISWFVFKVVLGHVNTATVTRMAIVCQHAPPTRRGTLSFADGFGNPVQAECDGGRSTCRLSAAGFDETMGTSDDVRRSCAGPRAID